jgi:benzoate/toluate 1,2-dioxygenase alpha subunit
MVDQSAEGLEVLKGASTYTYDGNWKVQAENGADGYHVASTLDRGQRTGPDPDGGAKPAGFSSSGGRWAADSDPVRRRGRLPGR